MNLKKIYFKLILYWNNKKKNWIIWNIVKYVELWGLNMIFVILLLIIVFYINMVGI